MNQTKKRLKIIKLAISITDSETIQLQILKLSLLKADLKIQEIITGLQAENYAQTQALITNYIETPMEEILQRTSQAEKELKKAEEKDIIEEFDLFVTSPAEYEEVKKKEFDFNTLELDNISRKEKEVVDFDALLNIETDDILPGNIELNMNSAPKDTFFNETKYHSERRKESHIDTSIIPKDTFFDTEETLTVQKEEANIDQRDEETINSTEESLTENDLDSETIQRDTFFDIEETPVVQEVEKEEEAISQIEDEAVVLPEESHKKTTHEEPTVTPSTEKIPSQYESITYIDQKFKNMQIQYPLAEESDENFASVHAWLMQISNEGYSDDEVEEIIKHIRKLTESGKPAEAAELLLISGATKSKFAQFMLARALYKGEILQKNLPEAFTLINRLALDDDYPEAICDLAQFYEYGIGIAKDKKRAEMLYRDAMDLGINRAMGHYERLRKQNSGFFSAFKK